MPRGLFVASCLCALLALGCAAPEGAGRVAAGGGAASRMAQGEAVGPAHEAASVMDATAARMAEARQLLVVVGESWNGPRGEMRLYERELTTDAWRMVGLPLPVELGAKGMAWARGQGGLDEATRKREGDGRAPAGVFELGPAFGYAPAQDLPPLHLEYLRLDETLVCVDDPSSSRYNSILDKTKTPQDWTSAETMRRGDDQYKYGVVVRHNAPDPVPGDGSCIFIHVRRAEGRPTAGCTALEEGDVLTLLSWLDPAKRPLLLQFPKEAAPEAQARWGLPTSLPNCGVQGT